MPGLRQILSKYTAPVVVSIVLAAMLLRASPASANNCLQDEFGKSLGCTAKDVSIAFASNPRDLSGNPLKSCNVGQMFSFIADFNVTTTATARENIGLYFATAGQATALTGTCSDNIISPIHPLGCSKAAGQTPQCLGTAKYEELDASPDNCGDITTSDNNQVITVEVDNVKCQAAAGTNQLALPDCTSWQQPGGTIQCVSPAPDYPWVPAAIPGAPSKCSCNAGFTVPIQVQSPGMAVTKTANPSSLSDPGGPVTYTVAVKNSSNFGTVTVNQICDDQYGNIATAVTNPVQPPCAAGKTGKAASVTCTLPQTIAQGSTYTCTFSGNVPEQGLTDTVTVNAIAQNGTTPVSGTASATVTVSEEPATATTVKTSASAIPTSGCATVRYGVQVGNTSASTSDETESLSALTDSTYGDITQVQGNILGTTCGVAAGTGTLSGSAGAGALPTTIAVGGNYSCQFDAKFCGNTGALNKPPNATTCAAGIEMMDTVTGTLTGDEDETVTQTPGKLTVDVCFSTTEATQ